MYKEDMKSLLHSPMPDTTLFQAGMFIISNHRA